MIRMSQISEQNSNTARQCQPKRWLSMKHLEENYEVSEPPSGFIPHLFESIEALGGWKALALLAIGVTAFYWFLIFSISNNRKKREIEKLRKRR
jgi:hypothetical protein